MTLWQLNEHLKIWKRFINNNRLSYEQHFQWEIKWISSVNWLLGLWMTEPGVFFGKFLLGINDHLSFHPPFRLPGIFCLSGALVYSETLQGVRGPCGDGHNRVKKIHSKWSFWIFQYNWIIRFGWNWCKIKVTMVLYLSAKPAWLGKIWLTSSRP